LLLQPGTPNMLDIEALQRRGVKVSVIVVDFPDPALEAAIRNMIRKPTGDILDSDLIGLFSFGVWYYGVANLEGLQHCVDLTELWLYENQIVDISPLAGLTNLMELSLFNNQIVDISPLEGLTNLTTLYLHNNQIVDLSALSGLTNLTWLDLHNNEIGDISALSDLINLAELWLNDNEIVDISALVDNAGVGSGDQIDLRYNNLDLTHGSPDMLDIEALQRRGVNVDYTPPN